MAVPLTALVTLAPASIPKPGAATVTGQLTSLDLANTGWTGTFTAVAPGLPFDIYGTFNAIVWGAAATSLTTTAGSANVTVASGSNLAVGQTVNSVNVPPGTILKSGSGTSWVLGFPAGVTAAAITVSGADANALFNSATINATINLERSFDGGQTWITCGIGGTGTPATYIFSSGGISGPLSIVVSEPERGVSYRFNCIAFGSNTSVNVNYRISATGTMATSLGIPGP